MADSFVDFEQKKFDVCVVGCGLAGLLSACRAALEGASVLLCSSGHIFNGSSFYPGTWGMGLIAPVDTKNDAADLAQSICEMGRHVADPVLVKEFVDKIAPSLEFMRTHMGIKFLQPKNTSTQEFIPCFDKKHRLWFGLEQSNLREQLQTLLDKLPIFIMEKSELIDFSHEGKPFRKLIFYSHSKKDFVSVYAKAVVLACGGFAQLFEKTLSPHENYASVQAIALRHGAALTNLEFFQIMPALLKPKEKIVFNEKSFYLARLHDNKTTLFEPGSHALKERSGYGPFTGTKEARIVDFAIAAKAGKGLNLSYPFAKARHDWKEAVNSLGELNKNFFLWLWEKHRISPTDLFCLDHFAHAANGGVLIDRRAHTSITGVFAAGELTGGMHGANRIGGLSSANCIVFGLKAGKEAARFSLENQTQEEKSPLEPQNIHAAIHIDLSDSASQLEKAASAGVSSNLDMAGLSVKLRHLLSSYCMVLRTEEGLRAAQQELDSLIVELTDSVSDSRDATRCANTSRFAHQLLLAQALISSARARKESRGAHWRSDHPKEDKRFCGPSLVRLHTT